MTAKLITGQCNCGAVRFEIVTSSRAIYACHCSICRRWSGTQGVTVMIAAKSDFTWAAGADHVQRWSKPNADWQSAFCKTCGSAMPVENDEACFAIPAGLLNDSDIELKIEADIWTDSKAAWDDCVGDAPKHPRGFGS